jgi:chloramphenicol 3-O-phosphotransferase
MDSAGIPEWVMWLGAAAGSMLGALVIRLGWKSAGGEKTGPSNGKSFTLDAALVHSSSVKHLTAAIEAATLEGMTQRLDTDKSRQIGYRLIELLSGLVVEVTGCRKALEVLADRRTEEVEDMHKAVLERLDAQERREEQEEQSPRRHPPRRR